MVAIVAFVGGSKPPLPPPHDPQPPAHARTYTRARAATTTFPIHIVFLCGLHSGPIPLQYVLVLGSPRRRHLVIQHLPWNQLGGDPRNGPPHPKPVDSPTARISGPGPR